jgi:predicted alternative tryptophan synthase beta-subunit
MSEKKRESFGPWPAERDGEVANAPLGYPCLSGGEHRYVMTDAAQMFEPPLLEMFCLGCGDIYYTKQPSRRDAP